MHPVNLMPSIPSHTFLALLFCLLLAVVHLLAGKLRFLEGVPRSRWLSLGGGISVAYVFVHLLPELGEGQEAFERADLPQLIAYLEHHVYLLAFTGLAIFYGLEQMARRSQDRGTAAGDRATEAGVFRLHMASFSLYNLLIGYLLLNREEEGLESLLFYFIAMALHFLVNDFGLRALHKHRYHQLGRWILSAAVLLGWAAGVLVTAKETTVTALFAFLAGGVMLNVLKEELPEERESRFWVFALGGGLYAVLLLVAA